MKAAVYKEKQRLVIEEVATPMPGPGQVLVKVKYCSICGTDVHLWQYDMVEPGSIMGHEFCGTIAEVGEGVTQWKPGDPVVGGGGTAPSGFYSPALQIPRFSWRTAWFGKPQYGAYAEYVLMEAWAPLPIPEGVSEEAAAMAEPCSVAVHAVRLSKLRAGDTIAVLGAGPIGLLCLQVARVSGAAAVYVSEPSPARAQAAMQLGADRVMDPLNVDVVAEMVRHTGGFGPHVAFECAAARSSLQEALKMVRRNGQVVVVSLAWDEVPIRTVDWAAREVEMKTAASKLPEEWQICLMLMQQGKVRVNPMITRDSYVPLSNIQEAFESLVSPNTEIKLLVVP